MTLKISGPAGAGIKSSGLLLSRILINHGFYTADYSEYPSLIRGGLNTYQLTFSDLPLFSPYQKVDLSFDIKDFKDTPHPNTACLGSICSSLGLDKQITLNLVKQQYPDDANIQSFESGYSRPKNKKYTLTFKNSKLKTKNCLFDGNEAFGWGFLKSGGNFYSAYPMTPATGAMHFLAQKQKDFNLRVIHAEDEIAAASLAAGAAYAGARSATGTSGGGFALMTETISFCGAADLGVVFYLVSRPGPATGLPTWTSQGDLLFAIHSGHGEFNKIILAPGNQQESFEISATALNLAAKFNLPVIVLSDKFIAESSASLPDLSSSKIRIIKTKKTLGFANSYEHSPRGFSTEVSSEVIKNVFSRRRQLNKILPLLPKPVFYGNSQAKKLIISWGSTKGPILEAIKNRPEFAFLQLKTLWPINPEIKHLISPFKEVVVIENNANSQLTTLLKSQFDFNPGQTILKFDGRPLFPEEIIKQL